MTREQFIRCIESEQEGLRRFLLALCCGDVAEADDIAQDALVKAYLSLGNCKDDDRFVAWLYKIAHNTFLDYRRRAPNLLPLDNAAHVTSRDADADGYAWLYAALGKLSDKERTAVLLYYIKGYQVKEISRIVDCTQATVRKQLSRAREHLKHLIGNERFE
ncbi:MAG: RNA polymerase sigma factor [Muribaculaceae bacterium]